MHSAVRCPIGLNGLFPVHTGILDFLKVCQGLGLCDLRAIGILLKDLKMTLQETCLGGCTDNVYCSSSCAEADWASCHSLMCSGPPPQSSEWSRDPDNGASSSGGECASVSRSASCAPAAEDAMLVTC